jgi:hypothetical protein
MTLANPLAESTVAIATFRQLNAGTFNYLSRIAMAGHRPKRQPAQLLLRLPFST